MPYGSDGIESFTLVTFDNDDDVTIAQTDLLSGIPDRDTIQLMLNNQPTSDEFSATSATVQIITTDSDGVILESHLLYFVVRDGF